MITRITNNPIGLDFGGRAMKAAQLDASGAWRVVALARKQTGPDADAAELARLREVVERSGLTGRRVVAACPHPAVMTEPLQLPPAGSGAPLDQLARAELARVRQLQTDAFEADFWPVPAPARSGDGTHVVATGCRHSDAEAAVGLIESAGFEVVALDTPACAAVRGCAPAIEGVKGLLALVDLGWDAARLTLVHQGAIVFERSNGEAGLEKLHATVCKALSLDEQLIHHLCWKQGLTPIHQEAGDDPAWHAALAETQALIVAHFDITAHELTMSFSYAGHRYPDAALERVVLIGGGASMPGVPEYLGSVLNVPVSPLDIEGLATQDRTRAAALAHAIGLARPASQATRGQTRGAAA